MDICDSCHIEEKIFVCCGRYPQYGFQGLLETAEGRQVLCCPHLELSGRCSIYLQRPEACRKYFCDRYERSSVGSLDDIDWLTRLSAPHTIWETE